MRHTGGMLHAKYGIITDAQGDCIVFMGSDNETGEALVENYEESMVFTSWQDKEDTAEYRKRFDLLWENRDEHVMTVSLPQAVEQKLVKLAPKAPPQEITHDRSSLEAAMVWQFLAAAPFLPNGEYACDSTAIVDLWPHQRCVVEDSAKAFPAGRLLCDEVGMGKTIEAILILRRLLAGRGVKRALLLVPAGLLQQWQDELREKGGLLVPYYERRALHLPGGERKNMDIAEALASNDLLLLSREWARMVNNREYVLNSPVWDLVLLDEAHAARRREPEETEFNSANFLLDLLRELQLRRKARGFLLMSATPMQTQPWEPWDLLPILGIGGDWIVEFNDIRNYYGGAETLQNKKMLVDATAIKTISRLVSSDSQFPPMPGGDGEIDRDALKQELRFAVGDKQLNLADWLRKGCPLGRRMHRNTRDTLREYYRKGLLQLPPSERDVKDEVFDYAEQSERECYDAIEHYIDERFEQLERDRTGKGLVMTIYRRRAASSPRALRRSLEKRKDGLEKVIRRQSFMDSLETEDLEGFEWTGEDEEEKVSLALPTTAKKAAAEQREVDELLGKLNLLGGSDSKRDKFCHILDEITSDGRAVLVFTEYTDTMRYLRDQLRPKYGSSMGCYSGDGGEIWDGKSWVRVSKGSISERLTSKELKILICTDAASEGLNLQAASALINYDLPWNPSKVEQRIGRIDRIGQQQQVLPIRNLFLKDSVDMRVYQALRRRCGLFEHFVGRMQPVLAIARKALGAGKRPQIYMNEITNKAEEVDGDPTVVNAFNESDATVPKEHVSPVTRKDIEDALALLVERTGRFTVKALKGRKVWRIRGLLRKAVEVTTRLEVLEQDDKCMPLTLGIDLLQRLSARLPMQSQAPLVIGEWSSKPYRCMEARWVQPDGIKTVKTVRQLRKLIDSWDNTPPPPGLIVQVKEAATRDAKKRVREMSRQAKDEATQSIKRQLAGARARLMRELARTLCCIGQGDLNMLFSQQIQQERRSDGRFHRALELLEGYPSWTFEEGEDAKAFAAGLKTNEIEGRMLGSEIDAALNDPRWLAREKQP